MAEKFEKINYDEAFFGANLEMMEHILLMGVIKSFKFYTGMKSRLCPRLPDGRTFRPDFARSDFNLVYEITARFWESVGFNLKELEMAISADMMDVQICKRVEQHIMSGDDAHILCEWLINDLRSISIEPALLKTLPDSPMFKQWIEGRAADYERRRLDPNILGRAPTLLDLKESVKMVERTVIGPASQVIVGGDIINSARMYYQRIKTADLADVDSLFGNGYRPQETSVVAGISGGGKTVLAMQLARGFAIQGINTIVMTTEQPPWQLMQRLVSNHFSMEFGIFQQRIDDAAKRSDMAEVELPFMPEHLWVGEASYKKAIRLKELLDAHLRFVDWSDGGFSIVKDFDAAISQVETLHPGWVPVVIIVDWVGGGLDMKMFQGDHMRHFYKHAGETIINHGKRNKRIMFMMAQLNKAIVKPSTTYITMDMLAECKSLVDNAANFLGITAMRQKDDEKVLKLKQIQYLCADKARMGTGGKCRVVPRFENQRFEIFQDKLHGGGSDKTRN
jgi:hypothetical protein